MLLGMMSFSNGYNLYTTNCIRCISDMYNQNLKEQIYLLVLRNQKHLIYPKYQIYGHMSQTGPKIVSYHRIEKNTPILIQQSIACAVYAVNYILLECL